MEFPGHTKGRKLGLTSQDHRGSVKVAGCDLQPRPHNREICTNVARSVTAFETADCVLSQADGANAYKGRCLAEESVIDRKVQA